MSKLTYTGEQIDKTIKKVKDGYADVSVVTAINSDVRVTKSIVDKNKIKVIGTLENAEITPELIIANNSYLKAEGDIQVSFSGNNTLNNSGVIDKDLSGDIKRKYIQTEEVVLTPTGDVQEVIASNNKLIDKVKINPIPSIENLPISNFPAPTFDYYIVRTKSSSSYTTGKIFKGNNYTNIYVKSGINPTEVNIYLAPIGGDDTESSYIWGAVTLMDRTTHKLNPNIIVLNAGDSVVSETSLYGATGTLTFTQDGVLSFSFSEDYYLMREASPYCPLVVRITGKYYGVVLDANKWTFGNQRLGGYASTGTYVYYSLGEQRVDTGYDVYNYISPKQILENYTNVFFEWRYESNSNYDKPTMKLGSGTGFSILIETANPAMPSSAFERNVRTNNSNMTNSDTTNSNLTNTTTYKALATPILELSKDGLLSWGAISGAISYVVKINNEVVYSGSGRIIDLNAFIHIKDTYIIKVMAKGENGAVSTEAVKNI